MPETTTEIPDELLAAGCKPIPELDGVRAIWPRGARLAAVREGAAVFAERFRAGRRVEAVASHNIATASYPTEFAFHGAAFAPNAPVVSIVNRMVVVQYEDFMGARRTLVWEPTVPEGSAEAPFYHQMNAAMEKIPGGSWLAHNYFTKYENETDDVLREVGLDPADVDYASFDHLHVQDPRMIMGTIAPIPGESAPREPLFPNAKLLVQSRELATLEDMHPMQWAWYVADGLDDVRRENIVVFDGDIELGHGVAIVWTPGHTDGNHSLVLNTPDGIWVSSENGVALDNWQPEHSKIPGVRRYHEFFNREIVPNANTLEDIQDQYDSMVLEKTLADPCREDDRWLQILPSSELADYKRQWPVRPTYVHGGISYGAISP